jgi:O-antigen biosynthesis protein WbqP
MSLKRFLDITGAIIMSLLLFIPFAVISLMIKFTSQGPVFYVSDRVGRFNKIFRMYKFRTMVIDTPPVATHLLKEPEKYMTPTGYFLRKTSIDEIPQLINIIKGEMSFVGPRPALFNQDDLIRLRTEKGIHEMVPGLTGWAQINGRDDIPIPVKVEFDLYYLRNAGFMLDMRILLMTLLKVARKEGVSH